MWGNVLRCRGTGKSVGMCVEVWGQVKVKVRVEVCRAEWGR